MILSSSFVVASNAFCFIVKAQFRQDTLSCDSSYSHTTKQTYITFELLFVCFLDDIGRCPKGWNERPGSNTCYYISDQSDQKTWENADIMCKRHQGNMVKVDSVQERVILTIHSFLCHPWKRC